MTNMVLTAWKWLLGSLLFTVTGLAQLAITEVFPAASTNGAPALHGDWWELTNFGGSPIDLTGYRFNDSNGGLTNGVVTLDGITIEPGESIVFLEQNVTTGLPTVDDFRTWWDTALPANLRIFGYSTNNIGLSGSGDAIRLWDPKATDEADTVAEASFGVATPGVSFLYDAVTGLFGTPAVAGGAGIVAATENGDIGSPGTTTGTVPLSITQQPQGTTVNPLSEATFSVAAHGMPRPRVRWEFRETALPAGFGFTLRIAEARAENVGPYRAVLDNGLTRLTSESAALALTEQPTPPTFTLLPSNATNFPGGTVTFTALATGVPPPTYQWFFGGVAITGATGPTLTLTNLTTASVGTYRLDATNPSGTASASVDLTLLAKPDLRITEVASSAALDADFQTVFGFSKQDWWELTSFAQVPVSLLGWRFDDNSASLTAAYTITNEVTLQPGESVIFVEVLLPEQFRKWWGEVNLPSGLKIISYSGSGLGLSSGGDAIRLWNATTTSSADPIAAVDFGAATPGISFNYNPDTAVFGEKSVLGQNGVVAAEGFASGGQDIGSPGRIREGAAPVLPPVIAISLSSGQLKLRFQGQKGATYRLQALDSLAGTGWTDSGSPTTATEAGPIEMTVDVASGPVGFLRVVAQ